MPDPTPISVLVVDDSTLYRRVLGRVLGADPGICQVTVASSGEEALKKLRKSRPDAVVLDVVMPGMDGLQVLQEIRRLDPLLPVIMFSTETRASAKTTIEALTLGASDCVLKPSSKDQTDAIQNRLLPRLKILARAVVRRREDKGAPRVVPRRTAREPAPPAPAAPQKRRTPVRLVTIGSSTGGPAALEQLFRVMPADFPVPILITQHMPPTFTGYLAQQLDANSPLSIREGKDGARIVPGEVWIAPGGRHMTIERGGAFGIIRLNDDPPLNACRPAVDILFQSAAAAFGRGVLAAVLTGMGSDGAQGALAIQKGGGQVIAQDESTSVVWGMPRAVAEAGAADQVLPLDEIGPTLYRIANNTRNRVAS